ncbi:MAG TPA: adenylyltransferase/cytidyltransferase family protein [Ferruginibacter sp.]|jgi:rfaE bifunctional protein nucleotidyltransferase chain/domain|nr:adenylyltransferase/cytidyltransferase family protein [Ferruginibacter sp.]
MKKVFVNGTFDILHIAHIQLLNYAKSMGDYLHVAIDTDARVKEKKGEARPIYPQEERKFFLINLKAVDTVSFFSTDEELENTIKEYAPDIMIVGSDWKGKPVIGSQFAKELKFYDRIKDYSTTATIQSIIDRG